MTCTFTATPLRAHLQRSSTTEANPGRISVRAVTLMGPVSSGFPIYARAKGPQVNSAIND